MQIPRQTLASLITALFALLPVAVGADPKPAPIDVGGYLLAYTPAPGWEIKSSADSGAVALQLIEREAGRVSHLAVFRVLKITVPADQRGLKLDEVAKLLCAGDKSYAAATMFPVPLDGSLRKGDHHRVGPRELASYSSSDHRARSETSPFMSEALVYVWLPDSFRQDGGLYLVSGFEYLNAASEKTRVADAELKHLDDVIAAIKPK